MPKRISKKTQEKNKLVYEEIEAKLRRFYPIAKNGWLISFSMTTEMNVLVTCLSAYTGQLIMRYFTNEDDAVGFINSIFSHDPSVLFV